MSIKNKATDRDNSGKIRRDYTSPGTCYWLDQCPKHWRHRTMTVPRRRRNKALCVAILKGADPYGVTGPLGNNKPHEYYW